MHQTHVRLREDEIMYKGYIKIAVIKIRAAHAEIRFRWQCQTEQGITPYVWICCCSTVLDVECHLPQACLPSIVPQLLHLWTVSLHEPTQKGSQAQGQHPMNRHDNALNQTQQPLSLKVDV